MQQTENYAGRDERRLPSDGFAQHREDVAAQQKLLRRRRRQEIERHARRDATQFPSAAGTTELVHRQQQTHGKAIATIPMTKPLPSNAGREDARPEFTNPTSPSTHRNDTSVAIAIAMKSIQYVQASCELPQTRGPVFPERAPRRPESPRPTPV